MSDQTWLSTEVAAELALTPLPTVAIALLSALVEARSFRSLYGDRAGSPRLWQGSLDTFPPESAIGSTGPDGRPTHPFGAWQWEPATAADIAIGIGTPSVTPENQILGSWWLAQRDYKIHGGVDLMAALMAAGHDPDPLDAIATRLRATWPGGTRPGFAQRYLAALPGATSEPPQGTTTIEIPLGERCTLTILAATDRTGAPITEIPADLLVPDDPSICAVSISGMTVIIDPLALGATIARGADQAISISVVQSVVAHLQLDPHPVFSPIAALARAAVLGAAAILPLIIGGNSIAIEPAPHAEPFSWERSPPSFRLMPDPGDPLGQRLLVEPTKGDSTLNEPHGPQKAMAKT